MLSAIDAYLNSIEVNDEKRAIILKKKLKEGVTNTIIRINKHIKDASRHGMLFVDVHLFINTLGSYDTEFGKDIDNFISEKIRPRVLEKIIEVLIELGYECSHTNSMLFSNIHISWEKHNNSTLPSLKIDIPHVLEYVLSNNKLKIGEIEDINAVELPNSTPSPPIERHSIFDGYEERRQQPEPCCATFCRIIFYIFILILIFSPGPEERKRMKQHDNINYD